MAIDLEQFHEVFFEESLEGLDAMEQGLLAISAAEEPDNEDINTVFRAAHSIKGGSSTFGFTSIAEFTHVLETLLDEARDGKRILGTEAIDLLLKSSDCLRAMVMALQAGEQVDDTESAPLVQAFEAMLTEGQSVITTANDRSAAASSPTSGSENHSDILEASVDMLLSDNGGLGGQEDDESSTAEGKPTQWRIRFTPEPQILLTGNEPLRIFRELAALGNLRTEAHTSNVPPFDQLSTDECFISWTLWLTAETERDDILEIFDWVIDECELEIELVKSTVSDKPKTSSTEIDISPETTIVELPAETLAPPAVEITTPSTSPAKPSSVEKKNAESPAAGVASSNSIRVGVDKVDSLINLIGELVITQSMLSELGSNFDITKLEKLSTGLEQLQQNTRELQESVMRIRMLPISFTFNRFPRMIRDLSAQTGKKVALILNGEQTELDKTVMEQISDPMIHLVRNAIDHGLETPEKRVAMGKGEEGTIQLNAFHKGGNIVIEITDDGNGLDAEILYKKAIEKGIIEEGQELSQQEIFALIFAPGFSTAAVVSDISGRGVGMDVVRRNIAALGGRIEIESKLGEGSTFRIHLPLTLAILDGQLVRVGTEVYIVPLVAIVESLQIKKELVNRVSGNMVLYRLRDDNVPIIPIYQEFGIDADHTILEDGLLVVVEAEGQKIGLLVDDLLAQQQVVIKSLKSNYKDIQGVSGATILGDGSVSMILDVPGLIRSASDRTRKEQKFRKKHQAA
ncbi:MAG: two-component system chemotaxis sensor kinase CheA [Oceanicoccus sp.]|jgi:two-component system chemotaxis sensor kinase CheA